MLFVDTPIEYLKGVGPARAQLLQRELDIYTYGDLLEYFPYRYVDRSQVSTIRDINIDEPYVVLRGTIHDLHTIGNGKSMRLSAQLRDATGQIELVWFQGLKWIRESLKPDTEYIVMGKPSVFNDHINIAHPDLERADRESASNIKYIPIYSSTEKLKAKGLHTKGIAKLTEQLLRMAGGHIPETLPTSVIEKYKLPSRANAIEVIHYPVRPHDIALSIQRMKFEELFFLQLDYQYAKHERQMRSNGYVFPVVGEHFNRFYNERLTFELTGAQKRVVKEIRADMKSGHQMNRLLQGDVGSGKTVVALMSMLIAVDNGFQACIMAPTEILANQHYESMSKMLSGLPINVGLLTGSSRKAERNALHRALEQGELHILIGTHALLEDVVQFHNLGLVVIDEQQRFGVAQRARLWDKNATSPPHVLVMTATPIPRTLAMTVYGDLEVSVIDQLPPGRKPVRTIHYTDAMRERLFGLMRQQIAEGRQVYVVYPLIRESEKMENLKDLQDGYESITRAFPPPHYVTVVVHGQMSADDKDFGMNLFASGRAHIMVATTVIEVGVNVPNATVMVIESAERFGLSQLHQLRGRVGRGADESYCVLMTSTKLSADSRRRMDTMVATNDGFRIAEVDLQLRGPGDIEGTLQSGTPFDLRLASITADAPLMQRARQTAHAVLDADPLLQQPHHAILVARLNALAIKRTDFGGIS